jgi:TIR domain
LRQFQWADFRGDYSIAFQKLLEGIRFLQQPEPIARPEIKSKGYVFISYADEDAQFVEELKSFLGKHGYAYWDFRESERKYDVDYSLELEGVIKDAAGTLSVISPNWKKSQISMQEFHFSRDVGTPVFLLKAGEPGPTLALSGLTYIDFTRERDKGFSKLDKELKRKGL